MGGEFQSWNPSFLMGVELPSEFFLVQNYIGIRWSEIFHELTTYDSTR